jgi:hypothetical protein
MPEGRLRPRELAPALPGDRRGSGSATAFETKSAGNEARPSLRGASPRQQFLDQWPVRDLRPIVATRNGVFKLKIDPCAEAETFSPPSAWPQAERRTICHSLK